MFSREEAKKLRQEFWTTFGKEYPHKWMLYNTGIKEIQLKFTFERKYAQVSLDIIEEDELIRAYYFEKLESLKSILETDYHLSEIIFDKDYELSEGKIVSRIYVHLDKVSIYNKKDWPRVKEFLYQKMLLLEDFFSDFSDYIRN
ncbi:protein of unknown function [Salinimicrobium catena]|uniref:DUF4268 domain-containing protein n=1 Tax=Salinimicrobium catena TaxID=390640 RepID=A0A1H5MCS3_9FLAO|nr:DUF4268 domain-containing protein [Salinimicrobium catena]SDL20956.1 protein of unknown function [Salinimicrobium catena]SEE86238.1 protein of unknown function [Salinimicrobium catena]